MYSTLAAIRYKCYDTNKWKNYLNDYNLLFKLFKGCYYFIFSIYCTIQE